MTASLVDQALTIVEECIAHLCKGEQYRDPRLSALEADYMEALTGPLKSLEDKFFRRILGISPEEASVRKQLPPFEFDGLTPEEQDKVFEWFTEWYEAEKAAALRFPSAAYNIGKTTAAGQLGLRTAWFSDVDKAAVQGIKDENLRLITRDAGQLIDDVRRHIQSGMERGINPIQIAREMRKDKVFEKVGNNLELIASDQVAKAQAIGRDTEFRQNGVTKVRISVAPDACPLCQPYAGLVVDINDTSKRPMYHIRCRCGEVPEESDSSIGELKEVDDNILPPPVEILGDEPPSDTWGVQVPPDPAMYSVEVYERQSSGRPLWIGVDSAPPPFGLRSPRVDISKAEWDGIPKELSALGDELFIMSSPRVRDGVFIPAAVDTVRGRVYLFSMPDTNSHNRELYRQWISHELAHIDWERMDDASKQLFRQLHIDTKNSIIIESFPSEYAMGNEMEDYCETVRWFLHDPSSFRGTERGKFLRERFGWRGDDPEKWR